MVDGEKHKYILVGTYMSEHQQAIQVLALDSSGVMSKVNGTTGIASPSFLALNKNKNCVYAVSEVDQGEVVSYSFDYLSGNLKETNRQLTNGSSPCYVSLNEENTRLFVSNYMGGSVSAFAIEVGGAVGSLIDHVKHSGHSIHSERQEGAHPHSIVTIPNTKEQLVCDLGTDHLYIYKNETPDTKWILHDEIAVLPGAGPRLVAFHPTKPFMYVIQELSSTIAVFQRLDDGTYTLIERINTLPKGFEGENTAAHIQIASSGDFLYASNRGHDSIVSFSVGEKGSLDCIGYTPTEGKIPRNFLLMSDNKTMLVANQDSDSIIVMTIDDSGIPKSTGKSYVIEKPVCLIEV